MNHENTVFSLNLTEEELMVIFDVFTELTDCNYTRHTRMLSHEYKKTDCFKDWQTSGLFHSVMKKAQLALQHNSF